MNESVGIILNQLNLLQERCPDRDEKGRLNQMMFEAPVGLVGIVLIWKISIVNIGSPRTHLAIFGSLPDPRAVHGGALTATRRLSCHLCVRACAFLITFRIAVSQLPLLPLQGPPGEQVDEHTTWVLGKKPGSSVLCNGENIRYCLNDGDYCIGR